MNGSRPLVTVIVPAFNAEQTVERTLRSVGQQTYDHLEILIVDDGSSDGTAGIAQDFCSRDSRARLIGKANGGVASARNLGIAEARGEWLAPVDADDLWHPTKIEKQVAAALAAAGTPGFVYCWSRHLDERDRVIGSGERFQVQGNAFQQLAYLNVVRNGSALLISRDAARAVGGYDESLRADGAQGCEDVMIQLKLARLYPVACVPEHLVGYRTQGAMSGDLDQISRSWVRVYARIAAESPSLDEKVLRRVRARSAFDDAALQASTAGLAPALRPLVRALALDPVRCGSLLLYRLARKAGRGVAGRRPPPETPLFYHVDPAAAIVQDPDALPAFAGLIHELEERRLRALAVEAQS